MKKLKALFLLILLVKFNPICAQSPLVSNQEKISNAFSEYFKLDRENIHLHFNKSTYLTSEEIWFKGYIIEKKSKKPYTSTTNVLINLFDSDKNLIDNRLFYAENSCFDGNFKLDENLKSGNYYFQVYTNYMNNFSEDESSIYKISIINEADKTIIDRSKINFENLDISFYPESGVFLEGTSNTFATKITDCNNNGISIEKIEVKNAKNETITSFTTNQFGYGKFDIISTKNEIYKVIFYVNGGIIEKQLPFPTLSGITFSVNNFTIQGKTGIKVKTNQRTFDEIKNENYLLAIQQNEVTSFVDFSFKNGVPEQNLLLPSTDFLEGVNTIYLVDKNLKKIAERSIFVPSNIIRKLELNARKNNDSITISGISPVLLGELSVSVLPSETVAEKENKTIYDTYFFENSLKDISLKSNDFINDFNRKKHLELDNILMTSNSKYNWDMILTNPPQPKFEFDYGLTIKGTVNSDLSGRENYKINMKSLVHGLNEYTTISNKNDFYFDRILAVDSTAIHFTMLNSKEKTTTAKMYFQLSNNRRVFLKPITIDKKICAIGKQSIVALDFPKIQNSILLDSVSVSDTKARDQKLKNSSRYGNAGSNGYKIGQSDIDMYSDVLGFIGSHGFDVGYSEGQVTIGSRARVSLNGSSSPAVFIDGSQHEDFSFLQGMLLTSVDEIYINKRGFGGGSNSANGIIQIYTKKGFSGTQSFKVKSQSFVIKDGFEPIRNFKNPKYAGLNNPGFKSYGTVFWMPKVKTDENGRFQFTIPNLYLKSLKIIIEGISSDGQVISDSKTVVIP